MEQKILDEVNSLRSIHGTRPLALRDDLSTEAQDWTHFRASIDSEEKPDTPYGYIDWIDYQLNGTFEMPHPLEPLTWWTTVVSDYRFYGHEPVGRKAYYEQMAQLLWKSTKFVGFGCSYTKLDDNMTVIHVVGYFDEKGNRECEYKCNVMPSMLNPLFKSLNSTDCRPQIGCLPKEQQQNADTEPAEPTESAEQFDDIVTKSQDMN